VNIVRTILAVRHEIPRVLPLMRDERVPAWAKVAAVVAAVLIVSPIDLLGDIPLLGFVDDGALLLFVVHQFVKFGEKRTHVGSGAVIVN
jgi:uncharacterized membrane protein YkvA (DUF1232 family)